MVMHCLGMMLRTCTLRSSIFVACDFFHLKIFAELNIAIEKCDVSEFLFKLLTSSVFSYKPSTIYELCVSDLPSQTLTHGSCLIKISCLKCAYWVFLALNQ